MRGEKWQIVTFPEEEMLEFLVSATVLSSALEETDPVEGIHCKVQKKFIKIETKVAYYFSHASLH